MKKAVAVISAVCLLCALAPAVPRGVAERAVLSVSADDEEADYTYENLTYRKYADHIEITGCSEDAIGLTAELAKHRSPEEIQNQSGAPAPEKQIEKKHQKGK